MIYNAQHALDLLRLGSGLPDARFREGQEEAIRHIVEGRGRLLVVQKTGWGRASSTSSPPNSCEKRATAPPC